MNIKSTLTTVLAMSSGKLQHKNISLSHVRSLQNTGTSTSPTSIDINSRINEFPTGSDRFICEDNTVEQMKTANCDLKINVAEYEIYIGSNNNLNNQFQNIDFSNINKPVIGAGEVNGGTVNLIVGDNQSINPNNTPMNIVAEGVIHIGDYTAYDNTVINFTNVSAADNVSANIDETGRVTVKDNDKALADFILNNTVDKTQFANNNLLVNGNPLVANLSPATATPTPTPITATPTPATATPTPATATATAMPTPATAMPTTATAMPTPVTATAMPTIELENNSSNSVSRFNKFGATAVATLLTASLAYN